ncbi:uroporphyrinogen decarboxylase family protein [Parablautia sp. Marseille-Q6255]|uniref:uroporphyrinogen decarboxylase family protein n=1 Tax=Parablautia sp. Marseille-Q6255 TaxID=3039593 RepID=UPI0024BCAF83|nr:uroporphyrinogen decarboxylase family protein [Parablautia sp. Marseille-Q6255]
MGMTSRERVLMALAHEETDRVPIDLGSSRSTGINANAYNRLKEYMGITTDTILFDVKQLLALPDHDLLRRLGGDVVILPRLVPSIGIRIDEYKPGKLPLGGGDCMVAKAFEPLELPDGSLAVLNKEGTVIAKRPAKGLYFDDVYHPLEDCEDEAEIDAMDLPGITDEEMAYQRKQAKELYENTEFAISGATSFSLFEKGWKDWGYENFLVNLYTEPELTEYYLDKLTDAYIVMMERYLDAVGDYVQIVQSNDDFGSQNGMLISPELYRKYFKPRHAKINAAIKKKNKNVHISLHSCGSIYPIMGDIIESGFDILNPVQKECANMDPVQIKKEFGDKLTIWGGACSTQTTMTHGTVDDIIKEAQDMIKVYAPGGGFVFGAIHNIQADIVPEKITALFETALKYGKPEFFRN